MDKPEERVMIGGMTSSPTAPLDPPSWENPRTVLARHGCTPQKRFSQNYLVSEQVVENIAAAVRPQAGESILELGPGAGTLSAALIRRGANVIGLERDPAMRALLEVEFSGQPLDIRDGDAAKLTVSEFSGSGRITVCGNLPYAISGAIFRRLVTGRKSIERAVIMIQREVQLRLTAEPRTKAYGALTVFMQTAFEVSAVLDVPRGAFYPSPKVESSVVRLRPVAEPAICPDDPHFVAVVKAAFGKRRKTLRNALREVDGAWDALEQTGIDPGRRGETLSIEEFAALANTLKSMLGSSPAP